MGSKKNYQYLTHSNLVKLIDKNNEKINLVQQSKLLGISRSSIYYQPISVNVEDKIIMDLIDEIYTAHPFYGNRKIKAELNLTHHIQIGRDHTRTLMKTLGLQAIYPKSNINLSKPNKQHKIYSYLLRGVKIIRPNQVWSTDITYIRLVNGWAYLIAVIDWYSRYVISWRLSNTLEIEFCLDCLNEALDISKHKPDIFNNDQGSHFTSKQFTDILNNNKIQISMDGRGRCLDNVFVERLWRTVKQENIYLNSYQDVLETKAGLNKYFPFYNTKRRHQSLNYLTPAEIYFK
ncbi:IS3 family transposase [Patescibacteria group bacterium]|nr:IS3 family transposase [Patescibacteria group bacterium]MBU2214785.1 IS3 family transposase [Patescibacteria group bacterium]MBU2250620.1 IS3 family transposase [Patescibacteria group bacterium]